MIKKKAVKICVAAATAALVAAVVLMGVFLPVKGQANDSEYWSEYDEFKINDIPVIETGEDGFTVLQLTDLHYHLPHMTKNTDSIIKKLVSENNPDFIVITGDTVYGPTNLMYTKHVAELMDGFEIPWAIVYGNHDDEGKADKYRMGEIYENSEYCVYENGPFNIGGTGNYAVNLTKNGLPFYSLIMMDSNRVTRYAGKEEYGSFTPSQVIWYDWLQQGLTDNGYDKSMMFFHIPFPEYIEAYEYWEESGFDPATGSGSKNEDVCCSTYNPGMFGKILEKGATTHVFVGHDHVNDYSVNYKGITLTYGVKSSRQFYFDEQLLGGTVIKISPDAEVTVERAYVS